MKVRTFLSLSLILIALAGLLAAGKFLSFSTSPLRAGATELSVIEIARGESPAQITQKLVAAGAIADGRLFHWMGRIHGDWKRIKAGEYQVGPGMPPRSIMSTLTSGISMQHPVTVREGQNVYEIADAIASQRLASRERVLAAVNDPLTIRTILTQLKLFGDGEGSRLPGSLEGYLFPDTYFFNRTMSVEEMLKQMVRRFTENWTEADARRAEALGFSAHQIVTLASMIEKETGAVSERPMISSVFHNRLHKKMRLQSDPTTIYGIWERYVAGGSNIRKEHLAEKNDYNTYYVPALPVGPIGNPGRESIQAALYPASSDYLFFVSHNDGTHAFTKTYGEHSAAVRKFQLDRKAREGKSWRDQYRKERAAQTSSR